MEKWLQKISNNWKNYLFIFLISIIIFMLFVHILFKVRLGIYWIEAEWSAGDILSFGGSILSFVGTVVLGCIATKVSIDNNNINKRLVEIESKRERLEEDKRLGYIVPELIRIDFRELFTEQNKENSKTYEYREQTKCTETTRTIALFLKMNLTSESIIKRIICKSLTICEYDFVDNYSTMSSIEGWVPFYNKEGTTSKGINQIENSFEEIIILSESDKETIAFDKMKKLMLRNAKYAILIEYEYTNTLQEKRNESLQLICRQDKIIKSELTFISDTNHQ